MPNADTAFAGSIPERYDQYLGPLLFLPYAEEVAAEFPAEPPRFLERAPFGYADRQQIERDMRAGGFTDISIDTVELSSKVSAGEAARGMCLGSPLTAEIEERGKGAVERATAAAERALQKFDGQDVTMSAIFATAAK